MTIKIDYTDEQLDVINNAINNVLNSEMVFISGCAGTGKTTICKEIAKQLREIHGQTVIYGAYTKTACKQLEDNTGEEVRTIHSLLKKKLHRIVGGKLNFTKVNEDAFEYATNTVVIIDEASMISHELFDELNSVYKKIIFLGDVYQIPPIAENDDKRRLLTIEEYKPPVAFKDKVKVKYKLSRVHRQDNSSGLYALCMGLRESIRTGDCLSLYDNETMQEFVAHYAKKYNDGTIVDNISPSKVVQYLVDNPNSCFIAYGRTTVQTVQSKLPEWYKAGGIGRLNRGITDVVTENGIIKESTPLLYNNTDIHITYIHKQSEKKWGIVFDEVETEEGVSILVPSFDEIYESQYESILQALMYNKMKKDYEIQKKPVPEIPLALMRNYYEYDYSTITDDTFNSFFGMVSTLRDPRTCTSHKSQGQQWDNVIVAVNNILFSGRNLDDKEDMFRELMGMKLLYTSITRAKKRILFTWSYSKNSY